jgi:hypothetical protein
VLIKGVDPFDFSYYRQQRGQVRDSGGTLGAKAAGIKTNRAVQELEDKG